MIRKDLLSDLDTFLSFGRDHLVPKSAGGPNHHSNRVAACTACDKLKADAVVANVEEARALVDQRRAWREVWYQRIRDEVGRGT